MKIKKLREVIFFKKKTNNLILNLNLYYAYQRDFYLKKLFINFFIIKIVIPASRRIVRQNCKIFEDEDEEEKPEEKLLKSSLLKCYFFFSKLFEYFLEKTKLFIK